MRRRFLAFAGLLLVGPAAAFLPSGARRLRPCTRRAAAAGDLGSVTDVIAQHAAGAGAGVEAASLLVAFDVSSFGLTLKDTTFLQVGVVEGVGEGFEVRVRVKG